MFKTVKAVSLVCVIAVCALRAAEPPMIVSNSGRAVGESTGRFTTILWSDPVDIATRNLYYGIGGERHAPASNTFTFLEEDLAGTNPKYVVADAAGTKWKVKIGAEARPETVASRLVWGVGYYADEDYFLPEIHITGLPKRLHRGRKSFGPGGTLHNVRLKRSRTDEKKLGDWAWRSNPFTGTRELNGLLVLMAVINNWDLKDVNNAVLRPKHEKDERLYEVSDLGASFGSAGFAHSQKVAKGNLKSYAKSKFITHVSGEFVDFKTPARPSLIYVVNVAAFRRRVKLEDLGKNIPRADARWMGQMLSRLTRYQISDAFKAAGYSQREVDGYTAIVIRRINALRML